MQGLILAAGMGKRLGKYTEDQTKCMVKVNGKTLIEYALDALSENPISKVIIVVGYEGKKLMDFIGDSYKGMKIEYVINNIYDKTNNIYSLWLAKDHLANDDTILLESDLIFESSILKGLISAPEPNLAVVAKFKSWMDGTVTILDDESNIVSFIPKKEFDWHHRENYFKTVNIYKFSKEFSINTYMPFLDAYIKALGRNEYYEQVLRVIAYLDNIKLKAHILNYEKWYEIDDVQDLDIASAMFSKGEAKLKLYQKRFGGYWRFPDLKDFCYLVNPYFPDKHLIKEIKTNFNSLLMDYPSGLNVQNLLASKLFDCSQDEIIVGNGAAELIRAIMKIVPRKIGIIYPTFNEYGESAGEENIEKLVIDNRDFDYSIENIKKFSNKINTLVLINPDNPSGHFFDKNKIIDILEYFKENNKFLVLDESFIDFAGDTAYTSINSEIMQKYQNLILVKSISKSYGVPGLRLGVAASGNKDLLNNIKKQIPIWNINSFAEYFMQIIGKYKSSYVNACGCIASERDRFFDELSKIEFLHVIPSKSNYFLCELKMPYNASDFTNMLLEKYDIFIKDCTGKHGFEGKNYIRIAVRDYEDNNYLIDVFKSLHS